MVRPCLRAAPACLPALPRPVLGVRFWPLPSDPFSAALLGRAAAASLLARWPGGFCSKGQGRTDRALPLADRALPLAVVCADRISDEWW
ncbi:hypothetical protein Veis_2033 [Verminephrobacter eiseniae EF01-2]|uniref:Uncharacterized protein n=1 Tax=Verminephrobacter eiseniae (strain EF01-2) TaxID=391735 RepID=A1WJH6_VEREI|nr:hypothetical protein Veis_2033 [Verminephrobacter eiseniae EF01-2]